MRAAAPAVPSYIYSIGGLRLAFPSLSVEMAFAQQAALLRGVVPDSWLATEVLSQGQNLYLTREMCWVLQIPGPTSTLSPPGVAAGANGMVDAYLMKPRSQIELNEMVSFLQPDQSQGPRFVAVVGVKGPVAPAAVCNGLELPIVVVNQIYTFTEKAFVEHVLSSLGLTVDPTSDSYRAVLSAFQSFLQLADNGGNTPEHRAVNYLTLRYPDLYSMALEMLSGPLTGDLAPAPYSFAGITTARPEVQGNRELVDVQFHYVQRMRRQKVSWFCRVDTTGQFPFLVSPLSRYYPHP